MGKIFIAFFLISSATWGEISNTSNPLPVFFVENKGQSAPGILFQTVGNGENVCFMADGFKTGLIRPHTTSDKIESVQTDFEMIWMGMRLLDINLDAKLFPSHLLPTEVNYLIGNEFDKHIKHAKTYSKLTYKDVYTHIDLQYYFDQATLRYDFILRPGADVNSIKMQLGGMTNMHINNKVNLEYDVAWGTLVENGLEAYQIISGIKRKVDVQYVLYDDHTYGFNISGNYDPDVELIIDPILFQWATMVHGPGSYHYGSTGRIGVGVDASDNNYYLMTTPSPVVPTTPNVFDSTYNGGLQPNAGDFVLYKLDPSGNFAIYVTYIGGNADERVASHPLKVSKAGHAFVVGSSLSFDFPKTPGIAGNLSAGGNVAGNGDLVSFRLNDRGDFMVYGGYFGTDLTASFTRAANEITDDGEQWIVAGISYFSNFTPTTGAYQTSESGSGNNSILLKVSPDGKSLLYASVIPELLANDIDLAKDGSGKIYIAGDAKPGYPITPGAYASGLPAPGLMIINPQSNGASDLYYSTTYGAHTAFLTNTSCVEALPNGDAFIGGQTTLAGYPTKNAIQPALQGNQDCFMAIFSPDGLGNTDLVSATYFGGDLSSVGVGEDLLNVEADNAGNIYVLAATDVSWNQTTSCALEKVITSPVQFENVFLVMDTFLQIQYASFHMASAASRYMSTDYFAINDEHCVNDIIFGGYVLNESDTFLQLITPGSYQDSILNSFNRDIGILTKLTLEAEANFDFSGTLICNEPITFNDLTTYTCYWDSTPSAPSFWFWDFGDGTFDSVSNPTHTFNSQGTYNVMLVVSCPEDTFYQTIDIGPCCDSPIVEVINISEPGGQDGSITIIGEGIGPWDYQWYDLDNDLLLRTDIDINGSTTLGGLSAGTYEILVRDSLNCQRTILVEIRYPTIFIPNAFSPGDINGINDKLIIKGEGVEINTFMIFDRLGKLVHTCTKTENCLEYKHWNGTNSEEATLESGIYMYYIEYTVIGIDEIVSQRGNISLIRE